MAGWAGFYDDNAETSIFSLPPLLDWIEPEPAVDKNPNILILTRPSKYCPEAECGSGQEEFRMEKYPAARS
jgi:hypothetical protein